MHSVMKATAASRMIASRPTLTPLFDCHVKSGIACFQMPENPELLDDLNFENGTSSGYGDLSQKHRTDCKRKLSNRPEHGKSKISRDNHHQRSSQYVEIRSWSNHRLVGSTLFK